MKSLLFILFATVTAFSALMVAISKKTMHAMLWLLVSFFSTACLFVLLEAEFVAAMQLMVYAGGILILYLFAIMLVDVRDYKQIAHFHANKPVIFGAGALIFIELFFLILSKGGFDTPLGNLAAETAKWGGNAELIGKTLFTDFILPFELVAIVLLVSIIGAVVLGKIKERPRLLGKK